MAQPSTLPTLAVCGTLIVCAAIISSAGELDPPAGPVAPTMKTLDDVEPRTPINAATAPGSATAVHSISQPGSYYLTHDILGAPGKSGIEVVASPAGGVTIDLNGFNVTGVAGSSSGIVGSRVTVRNGIIQSWGEDGLHVGQGILRGTTALNNGGNGIRVGWGSLITDCTAEVNAQDGIHVGDTSRIHNCVCKGNDRHGIHLDGAATVTDCLVYANEVSGIDTGLSIVSGCEVFSNTVGILDRGFSTITRNAVQSASIGIHVTGSGSRVEANHVMFCLTGYDIDADQTIVIRNSARQNTTHFDIVAGNHVGTLITTEAAMNTAPNDLVNIAF